MGDMPNFRQLYIMRHAERVDFTFGTWIKSSFDDSDCYFQNNLNMPLTVPKRQSPKNFLKDCPLTRIGLYQATLTGEAMAAHDVKFSHVFSSPSLRCVQTCTNVLKASGQGHLAINIEPGLFEYLSWYTDSLPEWMTVQELHSNGFNVEMDYKPVITASQLDTNETSEEYYVRNYLASSKILEKYPGNLLFVAHAASLDTCSRQLVNKPPRNEKDLMTIVPKVGYASVAVVQQDARQKWSLVAPPFPPLKHTSNLNFEWTDLEN